MPEPYLGLAALVRRPRAGDVRLAVSGATDLYWRDLADAIAARCDAWAGARRRVLVADAAPLDFAASLLAALKLDHVAVIPPNLLPATLAEYSRLPLPRGLPTATLEMYTSGSSGKPKCVAKRLAQLDAECASLESCWGQAAGQAAVTGSVPFHHLYGLLFRLLWPLASGRVWDTEQCAEPAMLQERLQQLGDAVLVASPALLARLPSLLDLDAPRARPRLVFSSGGPLRARAAQFIARAWGAAPIEVYGSTESGGIAWRSQEREAAAWTALPGVELSRAEDGALVVRSPFLPDAAPLRMEDAVEFLPDGRFNLGGRLDRVVKIEEKRVDLSEIEQRLARHAGVAAIAVAPFTPAGSERRALGAVVVLSVALPTDAAARRHLVAELRVIAARYFDAALVPRRWRFVPELPYDERGKLSQRALEACLQDEVQSGVSMPQIRAVRRAGERVELDLQVPHQLAHFAGHFPGRPLLPGVVAVDWAIKLAAAHFDIPLTAFARLQAVKFTHPVRPGDELLLSLEWRTDAKRLDFSYTAGARSHAAGRVLFDADRA
ncbi:MAG: AMP-binding protein [Rhodocyclaceae bacterium]|nr:AMP-binding protein [Rhodocyclaceae bacterium]